MAVDSDFLKEYLSALFMKWTEVGVNPDRVAAHVREYILIPGVFMMNNQSCKGRFKQVLILFGTTLTITGMGVAMADSVTLNPTYDAYATDGDNDFFASFLQVDNGNGNGKARAYMKFDLSPIPEGSTINSASLKLFLTQVPVAQSGSPPRPTSSQSYKLFKSSNVLWDSTSVELFNGTDAVPPTSDLVSQVTGTTADVDVTWTHANLQSAVQQSLDTPADNDWLSLVLDDPSTSTRFQGRFASNEVNTNADQKPRLMVDYTPPGCLPGDEELRITRSDYTGPNPIPWIEASEDNWFTISFTVKAICADVTDIKVQGGIASNLGIETFEPAVGDLRIKRVGRGNKVLTWTIDQLNADEEATLEFDVWAVFNRKGKAVCGVKNLTGDWSARGFWDDDGTAAQLTDQVGKLVVDIGCPIVP